MRIQIPKDDLLRLELDLEKRGLLLSLADVDLQQQDYWKFVRPLILRRLKEIDEECLRLGIKPL